MRAVRFFPIILSCGIIFCSTARSTNLRKAFKNEAFIHHKAITVGVHVDSFEKSELLKFIFNCKQKDYDQRDYDDLTEQEQEALNTFIPFDELNTKLESSVKKEGLFEKMRGVQTVQNKLDTHINQLIRKRVTEMKKNLNERLSILDSLSNFIEKEKDTLFIVVFQEGFFNFVGYTRNFGSFIPFFDDEWKKNVRNFLKKISTPFFLSMFCMQEIFKSRRISKKILMILQTEEIQNKKFLEHIKMLYR